MKKKVNELKAGDKIILSGKACVVKSLELSDIGKHGTKKCRIEAETDKGEKIVVVRPEDYPINCE